MYQRHALVQIAAALKRSPAVAVLGPRQVGKTTLARQLADMVQRECVYLDLQDERDRARIADPNVFFKTHHSALIVLDEVQYTPDIFRHLRPEIDRDRSKGRFLLLVRHPFLYSNKAPSRWRAAWPRWSWAGCWCKKLSLALHANSGCGCVAASPKA